MIYASTIGLEIHAQLKTATKMFCGCLNDPSERHPNVNICPICMAHPGTLPTINKKAVEHVIQTGLALGSEIPEKSKFDRKNYFYPDIPKGYQISQYDEPLCLGGELKVRLSSGEEKTIRITRVHLEEDTGRSVHSENGKETLVDFNRAGVSLMELVTEPDIKTAEEAKVFCKELQLIFRYLGVSDADMEKGEMRCEANISLSAGDELGTKVEVKNLNSFKSVERAIEYEIKRQADVLEAGEKVTQETRGWDEKKNKTVSQRSKEEAHDYRYLPEPDLPVMKFKSAGAVDIKSLKLAIPELPAEKRERFEKEYGLSEKDSSFFIQDRQAAKYFEEVSSEAKEWFLEAGKKREVDAEAEEILIKLTANYLISDLQGLMKANGSSFEELRITPENFAEFIVLIQGGKISSKIAKIVLEEMFRTGQDPSHVIEEKNLKQIQNPEELEEIAKKVIEANQNAAHDFINGKEASLQFLIGKLMAETRGKAEPGMAKEVIVKLLK